MQSLSVWPVPRGPACHHFGYYDKSPWSLGGRFLLGLELEFVLQAGKALGAHVLALGLALLARPSLATAPAAEAAGTTGHGERRGRQGGGTGHLQSQEFRPSIGAEFLSFRVGRGFSPYHTKVIPANVTEAAYSGYDRLPYLDSAGILRSEP